MVTENPLAWSSIPKEAEMIPFPSEEVTPPVTKIYLADGIFIEKIPTKLTDLGLQASQNPMNMRRMVSFVVLIGS